MEHILRPMNAQMAQSAPTHRHEELAAIRCPQSTLGQKGKILKMSMATYLPLFAVGASSLVAASAVSSLIPAPTPAKTMPPMKTFML